MSILRGRNFERSGEWVKAREVYETVRTREPDNAEAAHRLGVVADHQRRHAEAEQLFLFALERDPRDAALLGDLGYCYFLQGQLAKAESALLKAVALEPEDHRYTNNLGLVVGHQGRHADALEYFRKAGSEADAQYNLAFIYAAQNRVSDAKHCFQLALAADPTHRRAREAFSSFEEYDKLPEHLRVIDEELVEDGVRYVPYVEGGNSGSADNGVSPAGHNSGSANYSASRATRALHQESRSMLNRMMPSQRSEDTADQ
jgi:Flp pilus assembly protein TadD